MVIVMVATAHLVSKVTIVKQILMSVKMVITIVTLMLSVQTLLDHIVVPVTRDTKEMDCRAQMSMNVQLVIAIVVRILSVKTHPGHTHAPVKTDIGKDMKENYHHAKISMSVMR